MRNMNRRITVATPLRWLIRKLTLAFVRYSVIRGDGIDAALSDRPVCYVLEKSGLADRTVVDQLCIDESLPRPYDPLPLGDEVERHSMFYLRHLSRALFRKPATTVSDRLVRLVAALRADPDLDVYIVPVSIFWGRAPEKERSSFKLLFAEGWGIAGRTRRLMTLLLLGRETLIRISEPFSLRGLVDEGLDEKRTVRKVSRLLRVHFRRLRRSTIGPDLSHRRNLVKQILGSEAVRLAIAKDAITNGLSESRSAGKAQDYAREIAAHYSHPVVVILERLLRRLWTRLYDGVLVNHIDRLTEVVRGNAVVYVPCHRSHIDYLLLSYVVYQHGLALPHVAAGVNLNLPLIGPILRRGGAFFLRRSFRGNPLYAVVFNQYFQTLLNRGFAIEYFVEGGRSRSGRLLPPKSGMLAMTVRGFLENRRRPVVFVPVYLGYEKLIEGSTFIRELSGEAKQKESVPALIRSLRGLRRDFGRVYVNFGEPIFLEALLDRDFSDWREHRYSDDTRPSWLNSFVERLGTEIMTRINASAALTPIALLGLALLSTAKQAMDETELAAQLELYVRLLRNVPYSSLTTGTGLSGLEMIAYGERLQAIERLEHALGDVIHMRERSAVLMTYFRNNVLHLFAIPGIVACCLLNQDEVKRDRLLRLVRMVYPYLRDELYLPWAEDELEQTVLDALQGMADAGLLGFSSNGSYVRRAGPGSASAVQLRTCAQAMVPTLQRFFMTVSILVRSGSGSLTQETLTRRCRDTARRLSLVYQLNSPEFFDVSLFRNFVRMLRRAGLVELDGDGALTFDEALRDMDARLSSVLGDHLQHSILAQTR